MKRDCERKNYSRWHYIDTIEVLPGTKEHYSSIYNKGGNLIFPDGHAEYRKGSKLVSADFGLTPGNHTQTAPHGVSYTATY